MSDRASQVVEPRTGTGFSKFRSYAEGGSKQWLVTELVELRFTFELPPERKLVESDLWEMTREQLTGLYDSARDLAGDDGILVFPWDSTAKPEYALWGAMHAWDSDQTLTLLMDKDPDVVSWVDVEHFIRLDPIAKYYRGLRRLVNSATESGALHWSANEPKRILEWALAKPGAIQVPQKLIDAVSACGDPLQSLHDKVSELEQQKLTLEAEVEGLRAMHAREVAALESIEGSRTGQLKGEDRPIHPKERTSLLKLLAAALCHGRHALEEDNSTLVRKLLEWAPRCGCAIDDATVRKYLPEVRSTMAALRTKQAK